MQQKSIEQSFQSIRSFQPSIAASEPTKTDDEIDLLQVGALLWRGKWPIIFLATVFTLIAGYYVYRVATPKFAATAQLILDVGDQNVVDLDSVVSAVSSDTASLNTELSVIKSRGLIEKLVTRLDLTADPEFNPWLAEKPVFSVGQAITLVRELVGQPAKELPPPTEAQMFGATVGAVSSAIAVAIERNTYIFKITATSNKPQKSAEMVNMLAQLYLDNQIATKFSATEYAVNWLSQRVTELELELKQREDDIENLSANSQIVSVAQLEALNLRVRELRNDRLAAETALNSATAQLSRLEALESATDWPAFLAMTNDTALSDLIAQADGTAATRLGLEARVGEILRARRAEIARLQSSFETAISRFNAVNREVEVQSSERLQLSKLEREANATRVLYETFLTRLKETSVQIGLQQADSRILSEAAGGWKVSPRSNRLLTISFLLGAMIGASWVVVRHVLHDGFRSSNELEKATGYTVLGQIPKIPIRRRDGLIDYMFKKPTSAAAEAVRNLRTSILLSNVDNPPKVILCTSSVPGEGKTTLSIALANNLSGLGKRVLLIEGDIRRRTFAQYFKTNSKASLINILAGTLTLKEAVIHVEKFGADVLMGDHSRVNAADLFSSESFRALMAEARAAYDYVIIDTPPVLVVPDARVMGMHADAIAYVVLWDQTRRSQVTEGLRQLSSVNSRVSGVVLSRVDPKRMKKYGYGEKYGAYGSYGRAYYDT